MPDQIDQPSVLAKVLAKVSSIIKGPAPFSEQILRAARNGDAATCEALINCGADVNATDTCGRSALKLAALNGDSETCALLMAHGGKMTHPVSENSPWPPAPRAADPTAVSEKTGTEFGATSDVDALSANGRTALLDAATKGDAHACRNLLLRGANVNFKDEYGVTPLYNAIKYSHVDCTVALIQAGAGTTRSDLLGIDAIGLCKESGWIPLLMLPVQAALAEAEMLSAVKKADLQPHQHVAQSRAPGEPRRMTAG